MIRYILLFTAVFSCSVVLHAQDLQRPAVAGNYKGKLPCEDCTIIESSLDLKYGTDSTGEFSLRDKYISKGGTNVTSRKSGEWIVTGDIFEGRKVMMVILDYDNQDKAMYYVVNADGSLQPLDKDRHKVTADIDCTLKRML